MTRSYLIRFQDDLLLSIRLPQSRVTLIYFILFHSNTLDFWIVVTGINCAMQWHRISVNLTLLDLSYAHLHIVEFCSIAFLFWFYFVSSPYC